jgi:hypothetical protein
VKLRVRDGIQVNYRSRVYAAGEEFEAPTEEAQELFEAGWVSEVQTKNRSAQNKAR